MKKPRHPHDYFFRQSFGLPEVALDYLRNFLPAELAAKLHFEAIERVEGSFVSRKLRTHISDIIYRCPHKIRMLLVYILFTTEFTGEDWDDLVEKTPSPVKQLAMSTYDMLINKGKEQGIELGKEQGIELGKEQGIELGKELGIELGEEKKAREVVLALLLEFPEFSDARIAALAKVEVGFVRALRG